MSDIILHHYPQSPVAEKVRVVLGIKKLSWSSVEIPRLPPKPDLMPLTGGYRRTPVLQVGADIYCDSQCIIRELERRFPTPSLFPGERQSLDWGLSRWTDDELFKHAVTVVLGAADGLPTEFAADRGRLYFGEHFSLNQLQRQVQESLFQLQTQLAWVEQQLSNKTHYLAGSKAGLIDALIYHLVWFIRGRYAQGPSFLAMFERLNDWQQRIAGIGHGHAHEITSAAALQVALNAKPSAQPIVMENPLGLAHGMPVAVVPLGDGGDPLVEGALHGLDHETIRVHRRNTQVGHTVVHFPRAGYRVTTLS